MTKMSKKTSKTEFKMKQVPAQPRPKVDIIQHEATADDWEMKDRVYYLREGYHH